MKAEITAEGLKAAPPVAIAAAVQSGSMTLNDWVLISTLVYLGLQAAHLLWKWWREAKRSRRRD